MAIIFTALSACQHMGRSCRPHYGLVFKSLELVSGSAKQMANLIGLAVTFSLDLKCYRMIYNDVPDLLGRND